MTITDRLGRTVDGTDSSARPADPNAGLAIKTPCRAATTANITLSGLQTVDGIVLADAERVLVKNQTDAPLNGIYNASSGNWTRAIDWDGAHEIVRGTIVLITGGTTNALKTFAITSADPLSIGTSSVTITELAPGPELAALAALSTTGLMVRAGVTSYTTRSIIGTTAEITVTNGNGVSANPTLSLPTALTFTGKTVTGGTFSGITLTASDAALTLQDNIDATKQLQFQLAGITTATTRTLTIPDASGTLALTSNKLSAFAATTSAELAGVISNETGSGLLVFNNNPTLTAPILGTPASGVATNLTGTAAGLTAGNVTTNANLTGDVTSVGNATTLTNAPVIAKVLTGYTSGAGTISAADSILSAIQKLNGNDATNANLTGDVTSVGNATTFAAGNAGNLNSGTLLAARMPALTGDITTSAGAVATTIANAVVTYAKMQNISATARLLGRATAGAGVTEELSLGSAFVISGTALQTAAHTGDVTSPSNSLAMTIGATKVTSAMLNSDVFSTAHSWGGQQTFTAPILGTPASGVATNLTGTASGLTAGNVTTNANLTGDVTSVGNATTLTNAPVIAKVLTGYTSGAGTVSATDSILQAIQKLNGNDATNANLTGAVTSVGNATSLGSFSSANLATALTDESGTGVVAFVDVGTWTPNDQSGAGLAFTSVGGIYTRIGDLIIASGTFTFPVTADGSAVKIGGLPFTILNNAAAVAPSLIITSIAGVGALPVVNTTTFSGINLATGGASVNSTFSTRTFNVNIIYRKA